MRPGACLPSSTISRTRRSIASHGAKSSADRVALHGIARAEPFDGIRQADPVVDADNLGARLAHEAEQLTRADPEVDPGCRGR